jgi:hypothetical protein
MDAPAVDTKPATVPRPPRVDKKRRARLEKEAERCERRAGLLLARARGYREEIARAEKAARGS